MRGEVTRRLLVVLGVVVVAAAFTWAASQGGARIGGVPILPIVVLTTFVIQWIAFAVAAAKQTETFYDLLGSVGFVTGTALILALLWWGDAPALDLRGWVLAAAIAVWTVRLGVFLFIRTKRAGGDDRFEDIKRSPSRFLVTWTMQALWITLTAGAAWIAMTSTVRAPLGWIELIGIAIWLVGITFEIVADAQKTAFKADPANSGRFISTGVWSLSRHPNYFGEILVWIGVTLVAAPVFVGWQWIGLVTPLFVILLLTRVSGIPLLEKKAEQRWGDDSDYRAYTARTRVLLPFPK